MNMRATMADISTAIRISVFRSKKPKTLSKAFSLKDDGTLQKRPPGAMTEGSVQVVELHSIKELAELVNSLTPAQALAYGVPDVVEAEVVNADSLAKVKKNATGPVIARNREHFRFADGPGVLMLDCDCGSMTAGEVIDGIKALAPGMSTATFLYRPSASSKIFRAGADQPLRGVTGHRILIPVRDARDIPRAGDALYKRSWLAGYGDIKVTVAATHLERSLLIDRSVFQPERMDFMGGAGLTGDIEQRLPAAEVHNADGKYLDSATAIPSLTEGEEAEFKRLVAKAKAVKEPEVRAARAAWVERRVAEHMAEHPNADSDTIQRQFEAAINGTLFGDSVIILDDGKTVTVGEILDNRKKYHDRRCGDPLEPDYDRGRRIAWINLHAAGRPYIFSHAHGGQRFRMIRARRSLQITPGDEADLVERTMAPLREYAGLFHRQGHLIRISSDGAIYQMDRERVRITLNECCLFEKWDGRRQEYVPCDCTERLASAVLAGAWKWKKRLPEVRSVLTAPAYDPAADRVIETDGYDEVSRMMLCLGDVSRWPGVPARPTKAHVVRATKQIWTAFDEFPFDNAVSKGVMFAAVLTASVRTSLPTAPGFGFNAPTAGSGKTLLSRCLSIIAGEDPPKIMSVSKEEEEIRKMLLAAGMTGRSCLILDNISGVFGSGVLCGYVTTGTASDRQLGVSEIRDVTVNQVIVLNGNNLTLRDDLCRRILLATIDPKIERAYKRRFDLNPEKYVRENRLEILAAAYTILRAAHQNGARAEDGMGSFEMWNDTIRPAVTYVRDTIGADFGDPADVIDQLYEADPETEKLRGLLALWHDKYGSLPKTLNEVAHDKTKDTGLFEHLLLIAGWREGNLNAKLLGSWMRKNKNRVIDGKRLRDDGKKQNATQWVVENLNESHAEKMGGR